MIEKKITICLQHGLQARLAAIFVQKASSFKSNIGLVVNGKLVDGKSIMGVMSVAIGAESEITLVINGRDEQEATMCLERFLLGRDEV